MTDYKKEYGVNEAGMARMKQLEKENTELAHKLQCLRNDAEIMKRACTEQKSSDELTMQIGRANAMLEVIEMLLRRMK